MNQHDNILEAPPSPIPAPMMLGEQGASPNFGCLIPIVSQFSSIELPSKQLCPHSTFTDVPSDSFAEIMRSQLSALCTQFEANHQATPFMSHSNQDLDFHAMCSIIDQWNIAFDRSFNINNPLAFTAGAKNHPDILSQQGQMLKATDQDKFIASIRDETHLKLKILMRLNIDYEIHSHSLHEVRKLYMGNIQE